MQEEDNQSEKPIYQGEETTKTIPRWSHYSLGLQFVFLCLMIVCSASIFSSIGALLSSLLFDFSIMDNPNIMEVIDQPNVMPSLKTMQIFQHIGLFIVPALLFSYLVSSEPKHYLALDKTALPISYLYATIIMFLAFPLINWMIAVNEAMALPEFLSGLEAWMKQSEENAAVITTQFLKMDGPSDLILNLTMIAVIPAIGEELLFRGVIQRILIKWTKNTHLGIWIAAILFSALHMQFYGFLPRMMLGVLFGYLFVWSGSLLLPMICHLINNGTAVVFAYIEGAEALVSQEVDLGNASEDKLLTAASAFAVAGLLYLIYKKEKSKELELN